MQELMISCPSCKTEIKLTESLSGPIVEATRQLYEKKLSDKEGEIKFREANIRDQLSEVAKSREHLQEEVTLKVQAEREKIAVEEARKARATLSLELETKSRELSDLQLVLSERDVKLGAAQKAQADLLKQKRALESEKLALDLTVEQRIQETVSEVNEKNAKQVEDIRRERDEKIGEVQKTQAELLRRQRELDEARQGIDLAVETKVQEGVALANQQNAKKVQDLQGVLQEQTAKLEEAQKAQADLIRKQRELDDARREVDLTIEKRVEESLVAVRDKAKKAAEDESRLKVMEKEKTISSMQVQIEELKRRSEQGSQQLQGEVQELELENILRGRFSLDVIEPVPKGEFGGDIVHRIIGGRGALCGTILWETKRTKNWSDGWLPKLREDQRSAKAEIAILVSQVLPKGTETFEFIEGVWIALPKYVVPLALALRYSLIELAEARKTQEGQQTKTEMVYQYLTGQRFRHRVEALVEKFSDMRADLDREKRAMIRGWAKREEQINSVMDSIAGMYGDLQGIAGQSLKEIEGLDFEPEALEDDAKRLIEAI